MSQVILHVGRGFLVGLLALGLLGCAGTQSSGEGGGSLFPEYGQASYYHGKYQDRRTASGERFDQQAATAAHPHLAFDSRVKVTNTANGKSVVVRINDRGPFRPGRIIDLSRSAFMKIADLEVGLVAVKVELLD